jgi:signal transduction histidine kinase
MTVRDATRTDGSPQTTSRRLVWATFVAIVVTYVAGLSLDIVSGSVDLFGVFTFVFPLAGIFVLTKQPRNRIGWVLLAIGLLGAFGAILTSYSEYGLKIKPGSLPGPAVAEAIAQPMWAPLIGMVGIYLLLLFPDGHLPSPRWKKVAWLGAIGIAGAWILIALGPGKIDGAPIPDLENPIGIEGLRDFEPLVFAFVILIPASIVASAVSLVQRFRRSEGTLRLQLKWLTTAGAFVAVAYAIALLASIGSTWSGGSEDPLWVKIIQNAAVASFLLIPVAIGIAVLKYRLYDLDVVINKTLVYGSLAALITVVYVGIVVGIGTAIGSKRNLALSILATAVVAVGFQPARERVQRLANRLVYGKRATPYEVLSEFSGGMAHAVATDELLPRMARIVAEGTGAARVDVWLRVGPELVREVSWPESEDGRAEAAPVVQDDRVTIEGADGAVAVRHQGELLGAIGVTKSPGDALTTAEAKLLDDLASQAGLVLRNVRLIEELRTSRQRLVSAQDEERRRLERNLHDGAQQRLVSIALVLRMAQHHLGDDGNPKVGQTIDQAAEQLALALQELRELARGIHPAILTERGLGPALQSLAERSTVPATVESTLDGRLTPAVEATAYFVVSEALANVGKYSKATAVTVRAQQSDGELVVEVADDGVGGADASRGSGLRGLADRVAAVDGRLEVVSPPGEGTRLIGRIPIKVRRGTTPGADDSDPATPGGTGQGRGVVSVMTGGQASGETGT